MASSQPISTPQSAKTVVLTSSDGQKFEVQLQIALQSETIRKMIDDGGFLDEIVLSFPNITGETMSKVVEYCNKHVHYDGAGNNITVNDEMRAFNKQFVDVPNETIFDLILAANHLNIKSLLDLTCQKVTDMTKGKSPDEIRKTFNIKNEFTPEEEEEIRRENQWSFE
ncbi:hypothetical protein L1987_38239 [Smallanthus sonchifolius]|uniref:Uncharacterized protein n=1 Tax=Smallanthus sonchifolius TaxID=185202 RepID=A0ACB9HJJ3_9ASTR|nr:hypothetical protein L1987_38239 [Smallanthus sonchifolius]